MDLSGPWGSFNPAVAVDTSVREPGKRFTYLGDVNSIYAEYQDEWADMVDASASVTYETMLRNCSGLRQWALEQGYDGKPLWLKNDYAVGYRRSTLRGKRVYYLTWSGFEFVWSE